MQASSVDDLMIATILVGLLLSVANLFVSVLNGRSSQKAQIKATSNLRELYERTYRRTPFKSRRFVSMARPGRTERRAAPPKAPD
jgi:hypothetical protein